MSSKTFRLLAIFLFLLFLVYVYRFPYKDYENKKSQVNIFSKLNDKKVVKVEIGLAGQNTTLEKKDEKWKVSGAKDFPASQWSITSLEEVIGGLKKAKLEVASNGSAKDDFGFGDNEAAKVKFYLEGGDFIDFIVGKNSSYSGSYLTKNSDNTVYSTDINLGIFVEGIDWRDRVVFDFNKNDVKKVRFQYPGKEFLLEKKDSNWVVVGNNTKVKNEKIDEVLLIASGLKASVVPEQKFSGTGLEKHLGIIQFTGDQLNKTLMIGDKNKEGLFYVKRGDSDNIYLISAEDATKITKKLEDLLSK